MSTQYVTHYSTHSAVSSERTDVADQLTTGIEATYQGKSVYSINDQVSIDHATTDNVTTHYALINKVTTGNSSKQELTSDHGTIDQEITASSLCLPNMVYANCSTCQGTCVDPEGCFTNCTDPVACVCGKEYLLKGSDCVPEPECGCFVEALGVIPVRHPTNRHGFNDKLHICILYQVIMLENNFVNDWKLKYTMFNTRK